jgi:hypothetical protein
MPNIEPGDFIAITAWNVEGLVTSVSPATTGSEEAVEVTLQEHPDGPEKRYRLEPNEYIVTT